ncbi:MAG: glycosyltransferase family 2 protein [Gammaproteobacteria bacterium]|nr:glycosyltransferase family 2 protein [Gammaproteobacteria bacterium]
MVGKRFNILPGDIAWITGAGIMLPRKVFVKVGGYDERFFLYIEDIDLCLQVRKAGYKLARLDDVVIIHNSGASQKNIDIDKRANPIPSKLLFYEKYYNHQERVQLLQRLLRIAGRGRVFACWFRWLLRRRVGDRQAYAERRLMRKCVKEVLLQLKSSVPDSSTIT